MKIEDRKTLRDEFIDGLKTGFRIEVVAELLSIAPREFESLVDEFPDIIEHHQEYRAEAFKQLQQDFEIGKVKRELYRYLCKTMFSDLTSQEA